jgi:hypothetical protein
MEGKMFKSVSTFISATLLVAGWLLVGSAPEAKAYTTVVYHTIHPKTFSVRYRDVYKTHYVYRIHRIVHVTVVKPIHVVTIVTRVHSRTVVIWKTVNIHVRKVYPARTVYVHKRIHVW